MSIETNTNQDLSNVSFIPLEGEPYQQISENGEEIDCNETAATLACNALYEEGLDDRLDSMQVELEPFISDGYRGIDAQLKHGNDLTYEQAVSAATYVCGALNIPLRRKLANLIQLPPHETHLLQATALMSALSTKEVYKGLTSEEIAGLVAGTLELDTFYRMEASEPTIVFGGMGGDKGYPLNGENTKLFSLSTLAAIALSTQRPVHKHHSYPNTSKVAGQSAIEALGARSDFSSPDAFSKLTMETGLVMSSCHTTRTIHTLSHRLRGETVNHVIGPLAAITGNETLIHAMLGVNEKIHPKVLAKTLAILKEKGIQNYDNAAICAGTDIKDTDTFPHEDAKFSRNHVRLDEIAPPPYMSLVSLLHKGTYDGTYLVAPEDFYSTDILRGLHLHDLEIPNGHDEIVAANSQALAGEHLTRTRYLAMTVGMGLFLTDALSLPNAVDHDTNRLNRIYLRECTDQAVAIFMSGRAYDKMLEYSQATRQYAGY